ncbi:hypothetical protein [Pedobacter sp. L105]|uniref:hypothetical protein n=1 Tax=Pedobacter sp. L105 TaxID=1641871 RepID=UPI00131CE339|nr:hypothetical protein [Pedobacter sp. L105]
MRNYKHIQEHALSGYFERVALEDRFYSSHISLLMALFYYSDSDAPEMSFQVSRPKLMRFSRIRSIATYHKNIKDLMDYGYIEYIPSWHPQRGSQVRLIVKTEKR